MILSISKCGVLVVALALPVGCAQIVSTTQSTGTIPVQRADGLDGEALEAISLDGRRLVRPEIAPETLAVYTEEFAAAQQEFLRDSIALDAIIWYGRRLAYLGRYREAIEVYSTGLETYPGDVRLLRHRGHRYITTRQLDRAINDLSLAAKAIEDSQLPDEVEPDGIPNAQNRPRSTTNSNVYYHLGLAQYLKGDFEAARESYLKGLEYASFSDDMLVAMAYWLCNTYRKLGEDEVAFSLSRRVLRDDLEIIENDTYLELLRMYDGRISPGELTRQLSMNTDAVKNATLAYGIASDHLAGGHVDWAQEMYQRIISYDNWAAFGYIAAEADLLRLPPKEEEPDVEEDRDN